MRSGPLRQWTGNAPSASFLVAAPTSGCRPSTLYSVCSKLGSGTAVSSRGAVALCHCCLSSLRRVWSAPQAVTSHAASRPGDVSAFHPLGSFGEFSDQACPENSMGTRCERSIVHMFAM